MGLSGALALLLGACGASAVAPLAVEKIELPPAAGEPTRVEKTYFIPNESMSFDISLRGVIAGEASLAVGAPGYLDGRSVVIVQSQVRSAGMVAVLQEVQDDISSWIDLERGLVLKHEAKSRFGEKRIEIETELGAGVPGPFALQYQRPGKSKVKLKQTLPADAFAFDIHAMIGVLRAWQPEDGDEASFYMLSGRRIWRNSLRTGSHETIRTAMGRFPAVRIDGVAARVTSSLKDDKRKRPRNYSVWFSDDASRLPLLVMLATEYGELKVELVEYTRPDRRLSTR